MGWLRRLFLQLGLYERAKDLAGSLRGAIDRSCFLGVLPYDERRLFVATSDPVRYGAVALALKRLRSEGVVGALAEVGVWRGYTSRIIHKLAPERPLYLFDTFEGFPEADLPSNSRDCRFRETSRAIVERTVGDLDNIRIIPGYFPDSAAGIGDARFAFAMIDVDLYKATAAALAFFYPRMSSGGYIFVHDYNSPESGHGCCRAVEEFLAGKPEKGVEIPDMNGSIIIRKI